MKIVSAKQMASIESKAYANGSTEDAFMEQAGQGVANHVVDFANRHGTAHHAILLSGKGNNSGDAYVAGAHLLKAGWTVFAYQVVPIENCSPLCRKNHDRFLNDGGSVHIVDNIEEVIFPESGVIIDALFGTGFHGTATDPFAGIIRRANESQLPIIAIDIPSGLDGNTGIVEGEAIVATETVFLGLPKFGFFFRDGWNHVGKLRFVDFGLPQKNIDDCDVDMTMLTPDRVIPLMPKVINDRHKYQAGYVVGLAGSPGMPGASMLASLAALRAGAGIVRLLHPSGMESELSNSPYELIKVSYNYDEVGKVIDMMNKATATFIGPGLGLGQGQRKFLKNVLRQLTKPCVIDADALTIIAEEKLTLPQGALLTPHVGEMVRLLGGSTPKPGTREFLGECQRYANSHNVTVVLKGGPTFVIHPSEIIVVNPYGDPGMATAGSGDVLTGIIGALLAEGLTPYHAALLGVYLHGRAGECAAEVLSSYCMIAGDIIDFLPDVINKLVQN